MEDHPRIRGEHPVLVPSSTQSVGSSPHTRGAPAPGFSIRPGAGIIPAYAGSTEHFRVPPQCLADHPRIRGEHRKGGKSLTINKGSSPHTRGARPPRRLRRPRPRDHPRIRGEHGQKSVSAPSRAGSSPHTRGAPAASPNTNRALRIIPAYAGSTPSGMTRRGTSKDHPRIRGEHRRRHRIQIGHYGSSPHTRGARLRPIPQGEGWGIIPAYAGSTERMLGGRVVSGDHPRIRGEHRSSAAILRIVCGSSPHTRGARVHQTTMTTRRVDHPRIRGEHGSGPTRRSSSSGSSPHTRGARRGRSPG